MTETSSASQYWQGLLYQPDCRSCPLAHDRHVLPDGPIPAKLCFVGEAPASVELIEGRSFVGRSGQLLWQLAAAYGIDRKDVWVTNAILAPIRKVSLNTGAVIDEKQVKKLAAAACRKRLIYELMYVTGLNPKAVIVPLGNVSLQSLTMRRNAGIYAYRGSIQKIDLEALWKHAQMQHVGW